MGTEASLKTRTGVYPDTAVPVWQRQAVPEPRRDICEFLLVDRNNPSVFYCGLTGIQVDIAFKPCLLPQEERVNLCPVYRERYAGKPPASR
jgi:hypothetical protein